MAEPAPRAAPYVDHRRPQQHENDLFAIQQMTGALPQLPWPATPKRRDRRSARRYAG